MSQAAPHGTAIADLRMANPLDSGREYRTLLAQGGRTLDCALAGHCANGHAASAGADVGQLRHAVEIDQGGRLSQPEGKEWNKALPTGEEFGVAAKAGK